MNAKTQERPPEIMGEFKPLSVLWDGEGAPYPTETAARWALNSLRGELAEAGGIALHRGRLFIKPDQFAEVARRHAVAAAQRRYKL